MTKKKVLSLREPQLRILKRAIEDGVIDLKRAGQEGGYATEQGLWSGLKSLVVHELLREKKPGVYVPTERARGLFVIERKKAK